MLRLIMKLALTILGGIVMILNWIVGALLWDKRPFEQDKDLLEVIWSTNEPLEDFLED